ncbi:hypothetical protein I601_0156 [Nocardioides dokdonensis FR1436]|uniref:Acyl-CoA synthetase n=1 Tax=Nocardioides dokdonensis FR1436 TaxID=1300347 RepID=A0A1A9GFY8_9ACTN|nr:TIGR03089 family protein [Nocardioides dokdonensis]ANH36610.1 hypothetical protein I601_0156 [Nocardioides dokdonensis FR1436]
MTTFADLLRRELSRDPGRPLVTFYDHESGERTELSVTTYANWVAKAASLLVEEHDLERGDTLCLDLPAHWLGPVVLGAAWSVGLVVVGPDGASGADVVVCGPATVEAHAGRAEEIPVLACSLLPMGVRFRDPLPGGVHDVGVEIWGQPDAFTAWDPPTAEDVALRAPGGPRTHAALWSAAAAGTLVSDGGRLLSAANPASPPDVATFAEPLARGGSLVLVAHPDRTLLESTAVDERVTDRDQSTRS